MVITVRNPVVGSPGSWRFFATLLRPLRSACGRTVLSFTMAGGVLMGGVLVAALVFAGVVSPDTVRMYSGVFFLAGAGAGFVHGAVLAVLGRAGGAGAGGAVLTVGCAVPWLFPALATSVVVASWLSLTWAALHLHRVGVVLGVGIGWAACAGICAWAAAEGVASSRRMVARWVAWRLGGGALLAVFAILLAWLRATAPAIPFTPLHATGGWAVLLAGVLTLCLGLPLVAGALHLLSRVGAGRARR